MQYDTYVSEFRSRKQMHVSVSCSGNTIGKRYARTDEIGVPYAITVDFDTLEGEGVTLRERDTMSQVRVPHHALTILLCLYFQGGACLLAVKLLLGSAAASVIATAKG